MVVEVDLDKTNTTSSFLQGQYKIISGSGAYPTLTQTEIVNNVSGVYQFELARFIGGSSGITNFSFTARPFDFEGIYDYIQELIYNLEGGSAYVLNDIEEKTFTGVGVTGTIRRQGAIAVMSITVGGNAYSTQTIEVPNSSNLRPVTTTQQSGIGTVGSASSQLYGPVSVSISDNADGVSIYVIKTPNMTSEGQYVHLNIPYFCVQGE